VKALARREGRPSRIRASVERITKTANRRPRGCGLHVGLWRKTEIRTEALFLTLDPPTRNGKRSRLSGLHETRVMKVSRLLFLTVAQILDNRRPKCHLD
jgi:hypothetical protein